MRYPECLPHIEVNHTKYIRETGERNLWNENRTEKQAG
jgi:hypothetical protein